MPDGRDFPQQTSPITGPHDWAVVAEHDPDLAALIEAELAERNRRRITADGPAKATARHVRVPTDMIGKLLDHGKSTIAALGLLAMKFARVDHVVNETFCAKNYHVSRRQFQAGISLMEATGVMKRVQRPGSKWATEQLGQHGGNYIMLPWSTLTGDASVRAFVMATLLSPAPRPAEDVAARIGVVHARTRARLMASAAPHIAISRGEHGRIFVGRPGCVAQTGKIDATIEIEVSKNDATIQNGKNDATIGENQAKSRAHQVPSQQNGKNDATIQNGIFDPGIFDATQGNRESFKIDEREVLQLKERNILHVHVRDAKASAIVCGPSSTNDIAPPTKLTDWKASCGVLPGEHVEPATVTLGDWLQAISDVENPDLPPHLLRPEVAPQLAEIVGFLGRDDREHPVDGLLRALATAAAAAHAKGKVIRSFGFLVIPLDKALAQENDQEVYAAPPRYHQNYCNAERWAPHLLEVAAGQKIETDNDRLLTPWEINELAKMLGTVGNPAMAKAIKATRPLEGKRVCRWAFWSESASAFLDQEVKRANDEVKAEADAQQKRQRAAELARRRKSAG